MMIGLARGPFFDEWLNMNGSEVLVGQLEEMLAAVGVTSGDKP